MKKRIGISFTTTKWENYNNWFGQQGLADAVELVELSFIKGNEDAFYKCDGFILTGGVDIHPALYNETVPYSGQPELFQLERDEFEARLFHHAIKRNKPVLGICRGLQLVNVLQGGKLIQDLGATGNLTHRAENGTDKQHNISIVKGTLFSEITGSINGYVNSAHHQAIEPAALGKNLKVNAWSADGIIEGIEFDNKFNQPFMLCVQWHPERLPGQQSPFSRNILASFLTAVPLAAFPQPALTVN